jgi:hypothetical protein
MTNQKCWFPDCNEYHTKYCPICKKWLCDICRKNYAKRLKAFGTETFHKLGDAIF